MSRLPGCPGYWSADALTADPERNAAPSSDQSEPLLLRRLTRAVSTLSLRERMGQASQAGLFAQAADRKPISRPADTCSALHRFRPLLEDKRTAATLFINRKFAAQTEAQQRDVGHTVLPTCADISRTQARRLAVRVVLQGLRRYDCMHRCDSAAIRTAGFDQLGRRGMPVPS